LLQVVNVTASTTYTFSYWLNTTTSLSGNTTRIYNVTGAADIVAGQACVYSGGWVRQTCTFTTPVGCTQIYVYPISVTVGAGTVGQYFDIWGAQLVQGSVPGDYRATTSTVLPVLYPDYNGVVRARKLCETAAVSSGHWASQTVTAGNGVYALSVYAKAGERTYVYLDMSDNITGDTAVLFNLSTGTYSALGTTGSWTNASATITSIANGWYRCVLTATRNAGTATVSNVYLAQPSTAYTGDGSSGIYIANAQLEPNASVSPYSDTSTTLTYAPRFDYDPVTLAAKGLLVEESRTNLLTWSETFSAATWGYGTNTNATPVSSIAPNGSATVLKIYGSSGLVPGGLNGASVKAASAITYTGSVYAKPDGYGWMQIALYDGASTGNRYWYNIRTGVLGSTAPIGAGFTAVSADIDPAGNGYYRCTLTATSNTTTQINIYFYPTDSDGVTTAGNSAASGIDIWGAQLEEGASATSYISTTTSQVTRAADVASVNTMSPWYSAAVGTLYVEFMPNALSPVSGNARIVELNNGTILNRALLYGTPPPSSNSTAFQVRDAGVDQTALSFINTYVVGATIKTAAAMKANDFAFTVNGASPSVDVTGTLPTFSEFNISAVRSGTNEPLNGWLRRITYYPQRLSNAQLQSITA
jgi:hypothetical protein